MEGTLLIVVVIGLLNLIAFYAMKDWNAIAVFLLVATVTFFFTKNPVFMLVAAMVASSLFRASKMMEGFEEKPKKNKEHKRKAAEPVPMDNEKQAAVYEASPQKKKETPEMSLFESPLEEQFGNLQKNNESLLNNIKALTPLMKQSGELFKAMPPELMAQALKNFGKK